VLIKSITFPLLRLVRPKEHSPPEGGLVSVLDLDSIMPCGRTADRKRTAGISMKLMCISLNDVNFHPESDGKA